MIRPVLSVACCALLFSATAAFAVEENKTGQKMEGDAMAMDASKMVRPMPIDAAMQMIDEAVASNDAAKMKDALTKTKEMLTLMSAHQKMKSETMGTDKMSTDKMSGEKMQTGDKAGKM